jgi:hypothetical protein
MSTNITNSPAIDSLRQLTSRFDYLGDQSIDFFQRQTNGENPDPHEFMRLLEKTEVTKTVMTAQFGLLEKPLKTALAESH